MGAIKVFLKEVLLPIALAFCLASFLKPIYMPDGVCDYFLMWICVGLPFGIRRMCLWLVPSGYGISGSVGIFALNLIIPIPPSSAGKPLPWCRSFASTAADPRKSGIVSPFSGLLYCADCMEKLYYSVTGSYNREQAYFFCSSYRKNSEVCSAHYIRERVVEQITELKALIPELIHEFVDRIVVYTPPQKTDFIFFAASEPRTL